MIIDCHTHINNYHDEEVESLHTSLAALQREMRRNRVDIALALTSYKVTPGRPSTSDAVRATKDLKNIFIVAGISYLQFSDHDLI